MNFDHIQSAVALAKFVTYINRYIYSTKKSSSKNIKYKYKLKTEI